MALSGEVLVPEEAIERRVRAMAAEIAAGTPQDTGLSVLAILDGAFMFCADLIRRLDMPVRVAFVPVISTGRGGNPRAIRLPDDFPVRGAELLVVEDILDTGWTLRALIDHLHTLEPAAVRLAVMFDKPARREVEVVPDYVGFEVPDRWVVGYGLDDDGMYRNLPYVTYVE